VAFVLYLAEIRIEEELERPENLCEREKEREREREKEGEREAERCISG